MNRSNAMVFRKNGQVELGGTALNSTFYSSNNSQSILRVGSNFTPNLDAVYNSGGSNFRWKNVWSLNGTIQTSDIRAKKNIVDIQYGLKDILKLRPVNYNWNEDSDRTQKSIGLIAQELLEVVPEVVDVPEDENDLLGANYSDLIPILIKGMQELNVKIESQSIKIESQAAEIIILKNN